MRGRLTVLGGLFLALVVALVLLPPSDERQVPLTVYSAEPGGAKALRLWLEQLGHPVTTLEGGRYAIGRDVDVVLLLAPSHPLENEVAAELERWTRQGGRLVYATDNVLTSGLLLRRFGVSTRVTGSITRAVPADAGLLDPAIEAVNVRTRLALSLDEDRATGAVPLLLGQNDSGDQRRPIVAARVPADRGELIVLTVPALLSNDGLRTEANARLALSLIGPDRRARIAVDEVHHGFGVLQERSLMDLLLDQAWGRAIFLGGGVVLLFLLWRGRRFGRAVPVFVDRGRSLGEMVTSQASLFRAGGKRAFVADHLARQLRRDLAQTVGLPADATDAEIEGRARALGRDPTRALSALARTQRARSDRELLAIARAGEAARAELSRMTPPPAPPLRGEGGRTRHPAPPLRAGEAVGIKGPHGRHDGWGVRSVSRPPRVAPR